MTPQSTNPIVTKDTSALQKFHIAFEYDRTWSEAKQTVQLRPNKK